MRWAETAHSEGLAFKREALAACGSQPYRVKLFPVLYCRKIGGAEGDRTPDLMTASHALSQLSYGPKRTA